jgi:hypothetical protein
MRAEKRGRRMTGKPGTWALIRRAMHKIWMRVKGSIPVLDGFDDADLPHQATTFKGPYAAPKSQLGAVSDAYAREYALSVFDYSGGFCDLGLG